MVTSAGRASPRPGLCRLSHGFGGWVDTKPTAWRSVSTEPRESVAQSTMCGTVGGGARRGAEVGDVSDARNEVWKADSRGAGGHGAVERGAGARSERVASRSLRHAVVGR